MPTKLQIAGKLKFYSKPYGRQWKWRYAVHGRITEPILSIPKGMENVKIIDPLRPETMPVEKRPSWVPPTRHPMFEPFFFDQPTIKDHEHYNERPIKLADKTLKFHAGVDQVSLLTKTKAVHGLPESMRNLVADTDIVEQEELVKSYIKQALAFNPSREKCPGFKPPGDPKFRIATEYGTPQNRQMCVKL
jgi:hypothetical protein